MILVALGAALALERYAEWRATGARERERLAQSANIVATSLAAQIAVVNRALESLRDDVPGILAKPGGRASLDERLDDVAPSLIGVPTLAVIDRDGRAIASNQAQLRDRDFRDSPRYATIRNSADASLLYLSPPFRTPLGSWTVSLGRMLPDAQGRFDGYALAILDPAYIDQLLRSVYYAPDMRAGVIHSDGIFVWQVPALGAAGLDVSKTPSAVAMRHFASGEDSTIIEAVTVADHQLRVVATRNVHPTGVSPDKFLAVGISRESSAMYADWRRNTTVLGGLYAAICALTIAAAWLLQRNRSAQAQMADAAEQQRLLRENNLADAEARWRSAFEGTGRSVWDWTVATNGIFRSPNYPSMFGYRPEEVPATVEWMLAQVHPDDVAPMRARLDAHLSGASPSFSAEMRMRHKDGHYVWVESRGQVVERTPEGKAVRMIGMLSDITDRKLAETREREQAARLRLAIDGAQLGTFDWDVAADTMIASDQCLAFFGLPPGTVVGRERFMARVHPGDRPLIDALAERAVATRSDFTTEFRTLWSGEERWIHATCRAVEIGGAVHLLGVNHDITQRKVAVMALAESRDRLAERAREVSELNIALAQRAQAAELANRAKTAFLAMMSHELRTPLNGIMGMTGLALRKVDDPKVRAYLDNAQTASAHLLALLNDILDVARIEAEEMKLVDEGFDFTDMAVTVASLYQLAATDKGLRFEVAIDPAFTGRSVIGDPVRLRQILNNLLSNALKFTRAGTITLRAAIAEESATDMLVRCEVQDTGIGIAVGDQPRLFHRFEQVDMSLTRPYGGAGLGLFIVRRLAESMGGQAGVHSTAGAGSTFWFTARLRKPADSVAAAPVPAAADAEAELRRRLAAVRVLVVEDDRLSRESHAEQLRLWGAVADVAENGEQALASCTGQAYGLILMDVKMPVLDGLEATRRLRRMPGMADVPIVALTALALPEDRVQCLAAGMNDYLSKPVDTAQLGRKLLRWIPP